MKTLKWFWLYYQAFKGLRKLLPSQTKKLSTWKSLKAAYTLIRCIKMLEDHKAGKK